MDALDCTVHGELDVIHVLGVPMGTVSVFLVADDEAIGQIFGDVILYGVILQPLNEVLEAQFDGLTVGILQGDGGHIVPGSDRPGYLVDLLLVGLPYEGGQIVIKRRDSLSAVHLVLDRLHGDTGSESSRLYAFGRPCAAVTAHPSIPQGDIEGVLDARQALGRIVILIVDMKEICLDSPPDGIRKETLVDVCLGCF